MGSWFYEGFSLLDTRHIISYQISYPLDSLVREVVLPKFYFYCRPMCQDSKPETLFHMFVKCSYWSSFRRQFLASILECIAALLIFEPTSHCMNQEATEDQLVSCLLSGRHVRCRDTNCHQLLDDYLKFWTDGRQSISAAPGWIFLSMWNNIPSGIPG
ncbi:hypothetical protein Gasu2_49150 [Galdieria sulphuraria]|nr:hypothetical protein Gasu2_49150 [Galdieria sulphuraria]